MPFAEWWSGKIRSTLLKLFIEFGFSLRDRGKEALAHYTVLDFTQGIVLTNHCRVLPTTLFSDLKTTVLKGEILQGIAVLARLCTTMLRPDLGLLPFKPLAGSTTFAL